MRRTTAVTISLLVLSPPGALAQASRGQPVDNGAMVRVTVLPRQRLVGTIVSLTSDTLVLLQRGATLRLPTANVTRLQVGDREMRTASTLLGAGLGAVVGGVIGGALGSVRSNANLQSDDYVGSQSEAAFGAVIGAAGGALIGGIFGYNRPRWRWKDAPLPRVGVVPNARGVGIDIEF